ncbi:hypothetical protein [Siphonobacter sp. SORGH_AS_0500]|uniref:hypothetical protein n=1 Tax=Siphonobacter sp. SORGH_AS_0500 TaxID=1864824 RepID=UPI002858B962|nr:hypothetical protein [Siphonobacter sp. SORGH_AS_0500]MDR6195618.1 hypothetical protein [Siphonobacter sp. SORGH_AS_0500]
MKEGNNKGIVDFLDKLPIIGSFLLVTGIINTFLTYGVLGINIVSFISASDLIFSLPNSFFQDTVAFFNLLTSVAGSLVFSIFINSLLYKYADLKLEYFTWNKVFMTICVVLLCIAIYMVVIYPKVEKVIKSGGNSFEVFYVFTSQILLFGLFPLTIYLSFFTFLDAYEKELNNRLNDDYQKLTLSDFLITIQYNTIFETLFMIVVVSILFSTFGKSYTIKNYKHNLYDFEIITEDQNYNNKKYIFIGNLENYYIISDTNIVNIEYIPKDKIKVFKKQISDKDRFIR